MSQLRLGIWILAGAVLLIAVGLIVLNRASEKVTANVPPAVLIAVIGVLTTILFSLKPETQRSEFPVEFVVDPATKQPFHCKFFDSVVEYSDPGYGTTAPTWQFAPMVVAEAPTLASDTSDAGLLDVYRSVLFRQVLDVLAFTYDKSWDAQPVHWQSATQRQTVYRAASDPPLAGIKFDRVELAKLFPVLRGQAVDLFIPHLHIPPSTRVANVSQVGRNVGISLTNPFASLRISIEDAGVGNNVGALRDLCRIDSDEEKGLRVVRFVVSVSASYAALRSGHPAMQSYKRWVLAATSELERLGAERRWAAAKEDFALRYAYRTEAPIDEMMRKLREKVGRNAASEETTPGP